MIYMSKRWVPLKSVSALILPVTLMTALLGCEGNRHPEVVAYTSVDQVFSEPLFRAFEQASGIRVRAVYDTEETKSTGVLNRLIAEAGNPQADLFWSGDPVRPFLLVDRGLVEPYRSPAATDIPAQFQAGDGTWTGFAARARVLLVNRERLNGRQPPKSVQDLVDPQWRGQAAIANPMFGTTTVHVAAWFSHWGEEATKSFMTELKDNEVRIASSNGEVKRLVAAGEVVFGLTDTDDAFTAIAAGAPVDVVYPDQDGDGTLVMPTVAVLMRSGPNPDNARRLIDYLLSAEAEGMLAMSAAHMPLRADAPHPEHVRTVVGLRALPVDYRQVAAEVERIQPWLRSWVGL